MGIVGAVFSGIMSLKAAREQRRAGELAQSQAEQNALLIESETAANITQLRKSQRQTLGMSKAIVASSGIDFDARKINRLRFSEGGTEEEKTLRGYRDEEGDLVGTNNQEGTLEAVYDTKTTELSYGEQVGGDTEGSSAFQYLREMRRNFASDIGFMGKAGRSRARVTRMGGQIAMAQAKAGATQSYVSAINSFGKAYDGL